jgi:ABC-2 type transport system ATP-binding protein
MSTETRTDRPREARDELRARPLVALGAIVSDPPSAGMPAILVEGVRRTFGDVVALDGVDLEVEAGTVFALLGANGSGKTTTINILTTLIKADAGTASVAGFDVAEQPSKVREQISVTGQFAAVDHVLTARENLVLMGELRHVADPGQTAADLLDTFDLNEAADRRLLTFSGGMRRRLDIAMSLVGDSPIIFFDEPTTGLDPKSRADMWLTIRQLVESGSTVFLTTQYLEEADRLADEIAILHGGRIVASGTPDELKAMVPTGLVELEFGEEAQLSAAQRALGEQHEVDRVDSKLVVATTGSVAEMADMFIRLKDSGIEPTGFSRQLPTLDDVFFKFLDEEKEDRHASSH